MLNAYTFSEVTESAAKLKVGRDARDMLEAWFAVEETETLINEEVYDLDAFIAYVDTYVCAGADLAEVLDEFVDAYAGTWDTEQDYIEDAIDGGLFGEFDRDSQLGNYLDVAYLTRDTFINDMTSISLGEALMAPVAVFHNH